MKFYILYHSLLILIIHSFIHYCIYQACNKYKAHNKEQKKSLNPHESFHYDNHEAIILHYKLVSTLTKNYWCTDNICFITRGSSLLSDGVGRSYENVMLKLGLKIRFNHLKVCVYLFIYVYVYFVCVRGSEGRGR